MDLEKLTTEIRAVCPIEAVNARGPTKAGVEIVFDPSATAQQRTNAQNVLTAFDENAPPPTVIPLWLVLKRLDDEGMWEVYADYMEAAVARRRAFRRYMFAQRPIQINGNGFITTLQGAGLTAPQIARVTAPV